MKNKFLFFTLMLLIGTQVAVDAQELTLSDVQNSGCLDSKHARANGHANINDYNRRPTIILTKEGTILTVQLYNYEANCGTTDFEVTPNISGGSNGAPYSVSIQVIPIGDEEDCICPYNISFTIHDLEATDFFFSCCWFQGLVTLTENKPLVLGDINEVVMAEVNIDGLNYTLENITNTARLIAAKRGYDIKGELNIPSEINYEGQKYRVTSLNEYAFLGCYDLTSVDIPYSVTSIGDAAFMRCSSLTDVYCHAEDVPNTSNSVFTSTPIASATLHVPAGSIDKYKTTSPWSDFGSIVALPQQYFPEGTKWTEIRLDTLKYDSWYSKVGDEWVPNFETIEYSVQGEYGGEGNPYSNDPYKCVYTNSSEWTDSLTLLISEGELNGFPTGILVTVYDNEIDQPLVPSSYPFEWEVGTMIRFKDILSANATALFPPGTFDFGVVEEINEGDFGGVRPLKYSDVKGVRMIQGIGVATWNDGECIFGPLEPYNALPTPYEESRHYRSMLVHFERNGEVLYDVWPRKGSTVEVAIDGLNYFLYLDTHEAVIITNRTCSGELDIPSEVTYEGETFVVKSMTWSAFHNNPELTKVKIPKTIESIRHSYPADPDEDVETTLINPIYMNPFRGCTALESIEVDEENPSLKSVDGVLFSQDGVGQYYYRTGNYSGTGLYCYPEGARQKSYTIPENVEWIAGAACANNQYLTVLTIPNSTKHICYDAFSGCCNLTDVYCKAENVPVAWDGAFRDAPIASATLHVPASSIDKYKTTSPWSDFGNIVALTPVPMKDIMNYSTYFTITKEHQYVTMYIEPWWRSVIKNEKEYTMFSGIKGINYVDTLMFLRQDEAKCYFYDTKTGTEHLLFDFSLQKGDVYNDDFNNIEYEVTDVRDSIIGNESLRLIELISQEGKHDIWLEGIGSIYTGLLRAYSNYKDAYLLMCACPEWSTEWEEGCLHLFFPNNQFIRTADMTIKEPHWDRPLETEEDWEAYQEWRNAPTSLNAEFSGDTLHIWGRVRTSCDLCPYISNELKDNNVSVTLYRCPGPEPDCISAYDVDGRIPGFQRGIYEVRLYNKTIKLECSATPKGIMPFVQDGKVWTYEASNFIYDWEETFSLEGDTLISSRKCLKLYYTCQFYHQEHLYKGAMFEEEGKVYFFASGSTTPVLLYDFSYEPGTIIKVGEFELRINETRLVKYRSEYLKVIDYCILGDEYYPFKGIEGIGFLGGGLTCLIDGYTPVNTGGETSLKTCAVNGEVVFDLQDFYTSAQIVTNEPVTFTKDQMATIILPTAPDASKGKYYRLDRVENGQIVFEQEKQPRARVPYIIVPSEDFSIDISSLDLESLQADTVTVGGVSFIGSYVRKELPALTGGDGGGSLYYDIIDTTPDCGFLSTAETGKEAFRIGALRAYLTVNWDDPYNHHGSKSPEDKLDIVLKDDGTGSLTPTPSPGRGEIYDLSGRKWSMINGQCSMPKGIYIQNSRKLVK